MEDLKDKKVEEPKEEKEVEKPEDKKAEEPIKEEKKEDAKEKKPEEKKEEKVEPKKASEDSEEGKVDIQQLKAELEEANKKASEVESLQTTVTQLNEELSGKDAVIKEYEELVSKMVETKLEQVPADFKDLIPDNLDLKQKLNWLDKAEAKGLFTKEKKEKPNVEIGKPMNMEVPQVDAGKLSGSQLLRYAYNTLKK